MLGFLLGVLGLAMIGFGLYRAGTGTRAPLARGVYPRAVEVLVTSLLTAVAGLVLLVFAASGSIVSAFVGLLVGAGVAVVGGRSLFRGMIRQVHGPR
ncbi:MAG TPA: hypothetical protein VIS06_07505 [Mycobacteriales bacterium]